MSPAPRSSARSPLRISYLTPAAPLFGGVKVVLHQANLLADRGHQVTVVCPGPPPDWFPIRARYLETPSLEPEHLPDADVVVATFWTTIPQALAAKSGEVVHYCQGLEGTYTHNVAEHAEIHAAYRELLPAMAVSPHLAEHLRQEYGRPARVIPQPLESWWRPRWRWRPRRRSRILITGPFEIDWKGVATSLRAVQELRRRGCNVDLVRLAQWPLCDAEQEILEADEFHHRLLPRQVQELLLSCDLVLAASWEQEGFGLPVLEAMACGVPVVASDIAAFRGFASKAASLVPWDDPQAFADAAQDVLRNPRTWREHRRAGLEVAKRFQEDYSAQAAEEFMHWAVSETWRQEL